VGLPRTRHLGQQRQISRIMGFGISDSKNSMLCVRGPGVEQGRTVRTGDALSGGEMWLCPSGGPVALAPFAPAQVSSSITSQQPRWHATIAISMRDGPHFDWIQADTKAPTARSVELQNTHSLHWQVLCLGGNDVGFLSGTTNRHRRHVV